MYSFFSLDCRDLLFFNESDWSLALLASHNPIFSMICCVLRSFYVISFLVSAEVWITSFLHCLHFSYVRLGSRTKLKLHVVSTQFQLFSPENTIQKKNPYNNKGEPARFKLKNIFLTYFPYLSQSSLQENAVQPVKQSWIDFLNQRKTGKLPLIREKHFGISEAGQDLSGNEKTFAKALCKALRKKNSYLSSWKTWLMLEKTCLFATRKH